MVLGGSANQVPLIRCAKQQGYYVVLCDYFEGNIGKHQADVFYCVSTLDKEAVLDVARKEKIDGIITNSEPAMPTCSYIGNKLGLVSNPYESIVALCRKDLFRKFLKNNGFNCPQFCNTTCYEDALLKVSNFRFPLMVKPVDSSGSRGVRRIHSVGELKPAFDTALGFSRIKRVMIEEYIDRTHDYMIGGDMFVLDGEVVFWGLMNSMRNNLVSEFVPVGTSYPSFVTDKEFDVIQKTVQAVVDLLNINVGPFNLELMFDKNGQLFVIEMNPRNGGNKIPEILEVATGVDLIKANIEASLGAKNINVAHNDRDIYMSTYVLHSDRNGILRDIQYSKSIEKNILEVYMEKQIGDRVELFDNAEKAIGIILLQFTSFDEMKHKLEHINELIAIDVE
jgi:biotin carboxylase